MGRWSWVRISRPLWKRFLKKKEIPHAKNLKNTCGSPEIGTACWWHVDPYIRSVPGGDSVIRLSLGMRLVNLLPVAQRTNALTNGIVDRTMGHWSWGRISRPPWKKRFLKKSEFPHVKNLKNVSGSTEIGTTCWWHVDPYIWSVQGGECYKA